jgi:hypothetical protein
MEKLTSITKESKKNRLCSCASPANETTFIVLLVMVTNNGVNEEHQQ